MDSLPSCLRCKGQDWTEWGHWKICRHCEPKLAAEIDAVAPVPTFKPELFDKGIPSKAGG